MKLVLRVLSLVASVILLIAGIVVALFGEGSVAIPVIIVIASVALMVTAGFLGKKRIVFRVLSIVGAVVFALVGGGLTALGFASGGQPVADYDKRVEI